jgi:hypothetical protein
MRTWLATIAMLLVFIAGLAVIMGFYHAGLEIILPVIMIAGVAVLLLAIAAVVGVFANSNLASSKEALGLPDGSVRAIIALSLVLLFAIVAIFMYGDLSERGPPLSSPDLTAQERDNFLSKLLPGQILVVQSLPKKDGEKDDKFKIFYRDSSPAGEDFAKQLLVMLGTLVTSVASFYFGANAVSSAQDTTARALKGGSDEMKLSTVDPTSVKADGSAQKITIRGTNLANADGVMFSSGRNMVPANATTIKAENDNITCEVSFERTYAPPQGTPARKWDVIVSAGPDVKKLRQALETTA